VSARIYGERKWDNGDTWVDRHVGTAEIVTMPGGRTGNVKKSDRKLTKTRGNCKINIVILKCELNRCVR